MSYNFVSQNQTNATQNNQYSPTYAPVTNTANSNNQALLFQNQQSATNNGLQNRGFYNGGSLATGHTYATDGGGTYSNSPSVQTFGNVAPNSTQVIEQNISYGNPGGQYIGGSTGSSTQFPGQTTLPFGNAGGNNALAQVAYGHPLAAAALTAPGNTAGGAQGSSTLMPPNGYPTASGQAHTGGSTMAYPSSQPVMGPSGAVPSLYTATTGIPGTESAKRPTRDTSIHSSAGHANVPNDDSDDDDSKYRRQQ